MIEVTNYLNELLNQFWSFTQKHETLMGTIIGAFLATLFGILTQKYLNQYERKKQVKRYAKALFNDFDDFFRNLQSIKITMEHSKIDGTFDRNKIFQTVTEKHFFNYNPQWKEYLLEISDKIPDLTYGRIVEIYDSIRKVDLAMSTQSVDLFFSMIEYLLLFDELSERSGVNLTTNLDVLKILRSISENGSIRGKLFSDSIEKAFRLYLSLRFSRKIHGVIVSWLQVEKKINTNELIKRIEEWLGKQRCFRYTLIYNASIKSLVYESLKNSKKINFSWQDCTLIKEINVNIDVDKQGENLGTN